MNLRRGKNTRVTPSLIDLFKQSCGHLGEEELDYFQHWMTCSFLEMQESAVKDVGQYLWLKSPQERFVKIYFYAVVDPGGIGGTIPI